MNETRLENPTNIEQLPVLSAAKAKSATAPSAMHCSLAMLSFIWHSFVFIIVLFYSSFSPSTFSLFCWHSIITILHAWGNSSPPTGWRSDVPGEQGSLIVWFAPHCPTTTMNFEKFIWSFIINNRSSENLPWDVKEKLRSFYSRHQTTPR